MMTGMEMALEGQVEKTSDVLGRSALWNKVGRIAKLPYYLTIQFVRFSWRQELNKGQGDKAKMVKPVTFPMNLDMYKLCSEDLQKQMDEPRRIQEKLRDAKVKKERTRAARPF